MTGSALEYAAENYTFHLRTALEAIAEGHLSPVHFFMTTLSYRVLAICDLLRRSDRTSFAEMLSKAGNARAEFLNLVGQGLDASPKYICVSKNIGFTTALAAGDLDAAKRVAALSPRTQFKDIEYEDNFLFFHFMHRAIDDPQDQDELNLILSRWETVLEGGASAQLEVCRSVFSGEGARFESAFESLIQTRERQLNTYRESIGYDQEMFAAEGRIFIEGLAVLRLAEIRGLPTAGEYNLVPDISRVPLGTPLPPPNAWRTFQVS